MNSIIPNSLSVPITIPRLSIPFVHKISISASFSLNQIADFTWKLSELLKCCDQCVSLNGLTIKKGLDLLRATRAVLMYLWITKQSMQQGTKRYKKVTASSFQW